MQRTDLTDRTVMVTGAARGLGAAIVSACLAKGATVIATDLLTDQLTAAWSSAGERVVTHHHDVTDAASWDQVANDLRERGITRLDALVNNAGVIKVAPILETSPEQFRGVVDVNLTGAFLGTRMFVRLHDEAKDERPGAIVNISSARGLIGAKDAASYVASKFGVRGLTKASAIELGPRGIRVNAICPGPIESDMSSGNPQYAAYDWDAYVRRLPLGHLGNPRDIGEAAAWLVSDGSAFVTGVDLAVDGGLTATSHSVEPRAT